MSNLKHYLPLNFFSGARAHKVSIVQRLCALLFGSPNARRGNAIIYSGFDVFGAIRRFVCKVKNNEMSLPVYEIDRLGTLYEEKLPRIWLSEEVFNTKRDDGSRIFVECYPTGPDEGGNRAFELGDRYLEEGYKKSRKTREPNAIECFQAAEILYLHALRRGNRYAASRLRKMYVNDLCKGKWFESYLVENAKHALKTSPIRCACA